MTGPGDAAGPVGETPTPDQFVELYVPDPGPYLALFVDCLGYRVARSLDGWIDLRRAGDRVLLNSEDETQLGETHPFAAHRTADVRGYGVELALVVDGDLDALFERVRKIGWSMEPIQMRPWGVCDFRVLTAHGYYIRVTERQEQ
jgi:hypothetical protein